MKRNILLLLVALLPMLANAYDTKIDGICYNLSSKIKQAQVTSGGNYTGTVNIPESVTYEGVVYSVTSIEESAFKGRGGLTSISIPNSVTSIGQSAFLGCI